MGNFKNKARRALGSDKFSSAAMTALILAAVIALNVILYILVNMFDLYLYSKEQNDLTLSGSSDAVLLEADKNAAIDGNRVKISFCYTEDELKSHDTGSFVYKTANYFLERYPNLIEIDYINIITMRDKNGNLIEDFEKFKTDMNGNETKISKASVIFEYGNNYRVVTDNYTTAGYADFFTIDSKGQTTSYNGEEVMAGMISWVLSDEHKYAYFTMYHGEISDLAFSNLLASSGYYVDVVDLRREEVPENADMLIISNPTADFEKSKEGSSVRSEIDRLKTYLEGGGNLIVTLDPYASTLPVLEEFLGEWGISLKCSDSGERIIVKDRQNAITADGFTLVTDIAKGAVADRISEKVTAYSNGNVMMKLASVIETSGSAQPVLVSSPSSVGEAGGATVLSGGSFCVGAASEQTFGEKTGRMFVLSSVYGATSDNLVTRGYSNRDFFYALFDTFFGAGNMPYGSKVILYDTETLQNLKLGTARVYTSLIMLVPAALFVVGTVTVVRRKNR